MPDYYAILVQAASEAESKAGANNNKPMTPLRTKQAIEGFLFDNPVDMSGTQTINFFGKAGEQPGVFYETIIGNADGLPGILTNGYISINPTTYPLSIGIAGEMTYMFGIATDVASNPMIVLKADTGKIIKAYGGDNTNVFNVEHDGRLNISSPGQTEINLSANADSWVSLAWDFGVGTNNPLSKLHVEGNASNTIPLARFIGVNAGESVFVRIGLDAGGGSVAYWDFERDYLTGDLQLNCNQTFANISCLAGSSTGGFGIGTTSPTAKLHVSGTTKTTSLSIGSLPSLYEESGSLRYGTSTRSIFGSAFIVTREYLDASNGHGIDENSTINPSGSGHAYAAFDARGLLVSNNSMDHYVGYQFDPVKSGSGSMSLISGLSSIASISNGTVSQVRHISISDLNISGSGAATEQYAVFISGLVNAATNWGIYAPAPTKHYIGGSVIVGGSARTGIATVDVQGTLSAGGSNTTQAMLGAAFANGYGGIYLRAEAGFSEVQGIIEGTGYLPLVLQRRGGNTLIGTTTDNGLKLQVNGAMSLSPGASVTPPSNGQMTFEFTNNTTLTIRAKGSDGVVRSNAITLS